MRPRTVSGSRGPWMARGSASRAQPATNATDPEPGLGLHDRRVEDGLLDDRAELDLASGGDEAARRDRVSRRQQDRPRSSASLVSRPTSWSVIDELRLGLHAGAHAGETRALADRLALGRRERPLAVELVAGGSEASAAGPWREWRAPRR